MLTRWREQVGVGYAEGMVQSDLHLVLAALCCGEGGGRGKNEGAEDGGAVFCWSVGGL